MMNKNGELTDIMIWLLTVFILAVGFFILIYVVPSISGGLRTANLNNTAEGSGAIDKLEDFTHVINYGFLMLFTGLVISMFITSFLVRTHPIFLFMYIFFLGITLLIGMYLGNVYDTLITNPAFANMISDANFLNAILNYIVEITLAVGALSMIIVFAKFSSFGSGGQQF